VPLYHETGGIHQTPFINPQWSGALQVEINPDDADIVLEHQPASSAIANSPSSCAFHFRQPANPLLQWRMSGKQFIQPAEPQS